jgi:hypothetical protein
MSDEKIEVKLTLSREALDLLAVIGANYVSAGLASDMPVEYSDEIAHELASEIDLATTLPFEPKP